MKFALSPREKLISDNSSIPRHGALAETEFLFFLLFADKAGVSADKALLYCVEYIFGNVRFKVCERFIDLERTYIDAARRPIYDLKTIYTDGYSRAIRLVNTYMVKTD